MDWRTQLASIEANLDDLQTAIEGSARAADGVRRESQSLNGTSVLVSSALILHAGELDASSAHQRGALRELRQNIARLARELADANIVA